MIKDFKLMDIISTEMTQYKESRIKVKLLHLLPSNWQDYYLISYFFLFLFFLLQLFLLITFFSRRQNTQLKLKEVKGRRVYVTSQLIEISAQSQMVHCRAAWQGGIAEGTQSMVWPAEWSHEGSLPFPPSGLPTLWGAPPTPSTKLIRGKI